MIEKTQYTPVSSVVHFSPVSAPVQGLVLYGIASLGHNIFQMHGWVCFHTMQIFFHNDLNIYMNKFHLDL